MRADKSKPAPSTSIVDDAVRMAQGIARALSSEGYCADFSLASLKDVDRFLDENSSGGHARSGGLLSERLGQRLFALGAYCGEVVRRQFGGKWSGNDSDPEAEINISLVLPNGAVIW